VKRETDVLKKPFLVGVVAVLIVVLLLGGLISQFGSIDDRPEGIAERWLSAVGDLTRDGVHDDAVDRVAARGDVALGEQLLRGVDADGKSAFTELEVGRAQVRGDTARVPALVTSRGGDSNFDTILGSGAGGTSIGVLTLVRAGDSWRVVGVEEPDPALKVPSDGGDVVAKAPVALYVGAVVVGVGVAAAASALVRLAGREHEAVGQLHA
jgi:hypothetical protein